MFNYQKVCVESIIFRDAVFNSPLLHRRLFIHAFIFAKQKEPATSGHSQRLATSSRFEYYTPFIRMSMHYIYSKSKRSFHSQKEPGKCRTLFLTISEKGRACQQKGIYRYLHWPSGCRRIESDSRCGGGCAIGELSARSVVLCATNVVRST